MKKETLNYARYEIRRPRESAYIPGLQVDEDEDTSLICPSCRTELTPMEHGEQRTCPICQLHMELWGNALHIWRENGAFTGKTKRL